MHAAKKTPVKTPKKFGKADSIPAGEFKTHCLELMDEVRDRHREIVITKRGKPVAKLVPFVEEKRPDIFGCMKGTVTILGDIVGPTGEVWDADV
jgi:prevent-host-death family protein